jgi:putative cardiolipin synthase
MRELLLSAEQELLVVSPYYVPLDDGVQFVRDKVSRGIRSVMVTNSLASNNHIAVHAGYSKYRLELIRAGMELYETRASAASLMPDSEDGSEQMTLHTKLLIVDRRYTVVGSPNIDPRSLEINAEMALVIDSEPLARSIAERIDGLLADMTYRVVENPSGKLEWQGRIDGQDVVETKEPLSGRWRRFKAWFLKIVPDRQL